MKRDPDDHPARYKAQCPDCEAMPGNLEIIYYGRSMCPEFHFVCLDCGSVFELGDMPEKKEE